MSKGKNLFSGVEALFEVMSGPRGADVVEEAVNPAVKVASANPKPTVNPMQVQKPSGPRTPNKVDSKYAREDVRPPAVQAQFPDPIRTTGENTGVIQPGFSYTGEPMGSNPLAVVDKPQLPVLVPGKGRTTTAQDMNPAQRVVSRTEEMNRRLDADYAPYIGREDEIGAMAQNARKGGVPVEDFLNTRYGPEVTVPEQRTRVSGPLNPGEGKGSYFDAYDSEVLINPEHQRHGTIRDVISSEEAQVASKKSNTTKTNDGSNQVSSKKAGYEGFQSGGLAMNFIERHGGAAMIGAGAGMMSEGEVSAGGAARGAMFGVMGGKAARMVTGSMKGGAVNALGKSVGSKVSGMGAEAGAANRAGQYLQETMEGFAGSKSQEAMRVATFAGAGLAGFSMGRDRNHSRGMNSGRGSRF